MGGDIEKFCYAATVRSPPFPQSFVKKCGGKDGRFSPIPRLIVKKGCALKKAHPFLYGYLKSRERLLLCGALLQRQHRFGKLVADPDKQAHRGQIVQEEENERLLKIEKDKL